jgi:hypothetical protein
MPNPTIIHPNSTRTNHFLGIADLYMRYGQPPTFVVEPDMKHDYHPDAYMITPNQEQICVELQLSKVSSRKIQEKVNGFMDSYREGKHHAKKLHLVTDHRFDFDHHGEFSVEIHPWT